MDYKIVVVKRRHQFIEYECKECGKKFNKDIPNNLKEENQYGPEVQELELTLMNQANVTINKAQKITYGMTNGELNLSERGLRGAKSKMKAAGQFWNIESASWYVTIRTYIETCNRNNVNIYNALLKLSIGKPYTLKQILEHNVD